jgi:diguanylate cyclase (GGDEF)-like protein
MSDLDRLSEDLEDARAALGVARQIDLQAVADTFVRAVLERATAAAALLYLYDSEHDTFHLRASHMSHDDPRRKGIVTLDLSELRAPGPPLTWTPSVGASPATLRSLGLEEVYVVPLPGAGALLGMLLVGWDARPLPPASLDRVGRLVPQILPALVNAMVVEGYRNLVIKDDQTDAYNRRYFERFLSEEVYRAQRYSTVLSLIFLDMDNLREVNARYGHAMGSKTVREVSRRLLLSIRGSDRLFRYGGDEFCVVLPETDISGAREPAERLRLCLSSRPFLVEDTPGMPMTATFGIAAYPQHARTGQGLVRCADRAMQRAKSMGKNSLEVAGNDEEEAAMQALQEHW